MANTPPPPPGSPQFPNEGQVPQQPQVVYVEPPKKSRKGCFIALGIALVLLLGGCVAIVAIAGPVAEELEAELERIEEETSSGVTQAPEAESSDVFSLGDTISLDKGLLGAGWDATLSNFGDQPLNDVFNDENGNPEGYTSCKTVTVDVTLREYTGDEPFANPFSLPTVDLLMTDKTGADSNALVCNESGKLDVKVVEGGTASYQESFGILDGQEPEALIIDGRRVELG